MRLIAAVVAALVVSVASPVAPPAAAAPHASRTAFAWGQCPLPTLDAWECGALTVPLDWFDPAASATADIAVAVHRARGDRRGTLTLNPGGPGSSSLLIADMLMKSLPRQVTRRFDIVLWDPRGVGLSTPVLSGCTALPPALPDVPATGPVDWRAVAEPYLAAHAAGNRQCLDANRETAPYLGTEFVVRDLEALRRALDVHRWTYWGISYGTRIGFTYAQRYPQRLRGMVLDGAVQPNSSLGQLAASSGGSLQAGLALLAAGIGRTLGTRMYRIIAALDGRTYVNADGDVVDRTQFLQVMFAAAGSQELIPDAIAAIDEASAALFGTRRAAEPEPDYATVYSRRFVMCGDFADRPSLDQAAAWAGASAQVGTVRAGQQTLVWLGWCAGMPAFDHPVRTATETVRLPTPAVVLNASGDPATPWVWAREMTTYLRGASFITYDGVGHALYTRTPSRCVNDAVTAYLVRLERPGNVTCPYVPSRRVTARP